MNPEDSIPIVVVHRGSQTYLRLCLEHARKTNPQNRIVLIGDAPQIPSQIDSQGIEFVSADSDAIQLDLDRLTQVYRHFSMRTVDLELINIARWFMIRNWMKSAGVKRCLAIDSDVLLYGSMDQEAERFKDATMTFAVWGMNRYLIHCNFVKAQALDHFCNFVLATYSDPARLENLKELNRKKLDRYWITDMSLFYLWAHSQQEHPWTYLPTTLDDSTNGDRSRIKTDSDTAVLKNELGVYDTLVDNTENFKNSLLFLGLLKRWKRIDYRAQTPFGYHKESNTAVPFRCLHFHGRFKILMKHHSRFQSDSAWNTLPLASQKIMTLPLKVRDFISSYILWNSKRSCR